MLLYAPSEQKSNLHYVRWRAYMVYCPANNLPLDIWIEFPRSFLCQLLFVPIATAPSRRLTL